MKLHFLSSNNPEAKNTEKKSKLGPVKKEIPTVKEKMELLYK